MPNATLNEKSAYKLFALLYGEEIAASFGISKNKKTSVV